MGILRIVSVTVYWKLCCGRKCRNTRWQAVPSLSSFSCKYVL